MLPSYLRMIRFLRGIDYEILEYRPFYGSGYFKPWALPRRVDDAIGAWGASRHNPYLTSYARIVLRKPVSWISMDSASTDMDHRLGIASS
jgi:hypothetical protein